MPLTLLVGTAALALFGTADSVRAVAKPTVVRPTVSASGANSTTMAAFDPRVRVDSILVEKSSHRLSLFQGGRVARTYLVALGQQPVGDKIRRSEEHTSEL